MIQPEPPTAFPRLAIAASTTNRSYPSKSAAARWQAVVTRDPTANSFVYAVLTTRIYCRPSCPARLARRANVQFYDSPAQAERAGFRACKRCQPARPSHLADPQVQLIQRACATIEAAIGAGRARPTLRTLATAANLTPSHFHRVFKKIVGVTPGQYVAAVVERNGLLGGGEDTLGSMESSTRSSTGDKDPGEMVRWNDFDEALIAAGVELATVATTGVGGVQAMEDNGVEIPGATEMLDWDLFVEGLS